MKRAAFALIALTACTAARAQDRAISACENIIKGELIAPKSYEAVSRVAVGNTVQITYDAVNKYNAPIRATDRCEFVQTTSGWKLAIAYSEDAMKSEFAGLIERVRSGSMERADAEKQIPAIEKRYSESIIRHATRELLAQAAGPYPIPPSMTSLRR